MLHPSVRNHSKHVVRISGLVTLVLVLLCSEARADPPSSPQPPSNSKHNITLRFERALRSVDLVVVDRNGDPKPQARVSLSYKHAEGQATVTKTTGRNGRVRFDELPDTDMTVSLPAKDDTVALYKGKNKTVALPDKKIPEVGERQTISGLTVKVSREAEGEKREYTRTTGDDGTVRFELEEGEYTVSYIWKRQEKRIREVEAVKSQTLSFAIQVGREDAESFSPLEFSFDVGLQGSTFNSVSGLVDPSMPVPDPNMPTPESGVFEDTNFFVGIFAEQAHGRRQQHQWFISLQFGGINVEEPTGRQIIEDADAVSFGTAYRRILFRGRTSYADGYVGGSAQVYSPTNESSDERVADDFLTEYNLHYGVMNENPAGLYRGSYVQIGAGQSDRFVDRDRWFVAEGQILANFEKAKRYKVFARFTFNSDLGRGADDFRVTFGTRVALRERIASLGTITATNENGRTKQDGTSTTPAPASGGTH